MGIVWFILILGAIILVHEFGHFIFSKLFKVYVYEFSIGMGPKILHYKKKKGETEYCLRLIPIGGFVSLAGEDADDNSKIPNERKLYNKPVWQRFIIMVAGATFNFIFAFVVLLIMAGVYGAPNNDPVIYSLTPEYPAEKAGVEVGDRITSIDNQKVTSWDEVSLYISLSKGEKIEMVLEDKNGEEKTVELEPIEIEQEDGTKRYVVGMSIDPTRKKGFVPMLSYAGEQTVNLFKVMLTTLKQLFTGKAGVGDLSGPVGIYKIVDKTAENGLENLLSLTAYLSMNVGVINLLPFPAFDGGRVLFLIIEKIRKKPVKAKTEAIVNSIGFCILILLMLVVTVKDIIQLF